MAEVWPWTLVEGAASRLDRTRHVRCLGLSRSEIQRLGGGIDDVEHRIGRRRDPLTSDEKAIRVRYGHHSDIAFQCHAFLRVLVCRQILAGTVLLHARVESKVGAPLAGEADRRL